MRGPLVVALALLYSTSSAQLVDFQVHQPAPFPQNAQRCTFELFEHSFGNSFGVPALADFSPPTNCGKIGSWAGVTLNLTSTSIGRQFDRLAIVSFSGNEIWRSSTPEPTNGTGIIWTYIKDVSHFIPLFTKPGFFQLELDNLLSDDLGLNGVYNVTFSITFIASSRTLPPALKADLIVPITNFTSVPPAFTSPISLPQNTISAFFELLASGNGNEEFWFNNAADKFFNDIAPGNTFPHGPFREVRVLVDDMLAGVVWPYAVWFTGADTPPSWRPITSYGALEQPTYVVDLTPFVPLIVDGSAHTISLDVVSVDTNNTINQNWFVSGLIHAFLDPSNKRTTGAITSHSAPLFPTGTVTGSVQGPDVNITVQASRQIRIAAEVISGSGRRTNVVWTQSLGYRNDQVYADNVTVQNVAQLTTGTSTSTHNGAQVVVDRFQYPMNIDLSASPDFVNFLALFNHSYLRTFTPGPFTFSTTISNHQSATGTFSTATHTGIGSNSNQFSYSDSKGNTFTRQVSVANNTILSDKQGGSLAGLAGGPFIVDDETAAVAAEGGEEQTPMTKVGAMRAPGRAGV